jgi:hypothetical protein
VRPGRAAWPLPPAGLARGRAAAASGGTDSESQAAVPAITIELRAQLIELLDRG